MLPTGGGQKSPRASHRGRIAVTVQLASAVGQRGALLRYPASAALAILAVTVVFAVGLIVGNVPEGLLPVITLALAACAPRADR